MECEGQTWFRGRHRAIVVEGDCRSGGCAPSAAAPRCCGHGSSTAGGRGANDIGDVIGQALRRDLRQPYGRDHALLAASEPDHERPIKVAALRAGRPAINLDDHSRQPRTNGITIGCSRSRQVKSRTRSQWVARVKLRLQPHGSDHHSGRDPRPSRANGAGCPPLRARRSRDERLLLRLHDGHPTTPYPAGKIARALGAAGLSR